VNLLKFNKAKGKILHMGQSNPKHKYRLVGEWFERSPEKKDFRVLVDKSLNMTWQYVLAGQKTNCVLGCIKSSMASSSREAILPLYSSLMRLQRDLIAAFQYLKGPTRKLERDFLQGSVVIGLGAMALQ